MRILIHCGREKKEEAKMGGNLCENDKESDFLICLEGLQHLLSDNVGEWEGFFWKEVQGVEKDEKFIKIRFLIILKLKMYKTNRNLS